MFKYSYRIPDIVLVWPPARHGETKMGMNCGNGHCGARNFLTKEEKLEMLKEYEDNLSSELKGVKERMKELAKE